MALIKCPWCEMTISDEDTRCPLCRRPLNAKPSDIAFFHAAQRKDKDYLAAREAEQEDWDRAEREETPREQAPSYGAPTEYCRFCGEEIPERSTFCPVCDSRLRASKWWQLLLVAALVAFAYYLGGR